MSNELTNVVFAKVDTDENPETPQEAGVESYPTFVLYKNGKKTNFVEFMKWQQVLARLEQLLAL